MKKVPPSAYKKQALLDLLSGKLTSANGEQSLSQLIQLAVERALQEALEAEQAEFLGRERYSRERKAPGYRNGYEPGTLKTAEGVLQVELPQVRGSGEPYRSSLWQSLSRTSDHLHELVKELYVHGLSTRDIEQALATSLGQFVVSKSQVSQLTASLLEDYERFKQRDLSGFDVVYVFLDTVFESLRRYGCSKGMLCCWGICADGSKVLLDMTLLNSEAREAILDFLYGMVKRGLRTPLTVTTDGAPGMIAAVEACWPRSKRIRCWFHKMQNLQHKVPKAAWPEFKALVQDMRDAPTFEEGEQRLARNVERYRSEWPQACRCLLDDAKASLNHLHVPLRHRTLVRTTNLVERTFVEERRRLKTIPHVWDEQQLTKLVFAVLIRVSDRWSKRCFSEFEQQQLYLLRKELLGENDEHEPLTSRQKRRSASQNPDPFYRKIGT